MPVSWGQKWKEKYGRTKMVLGEKIREALASVLPITLIVLVLCFTVAPVPTDVLLAFLVGAVLLIVGMGFFTLGADVAMTPIGERVGAAMTKSRKLWVVMSVGAGPAGSCKPGSRHSKCDSGGRGCVRCRRIPGVCTATNFVPDSS